MALKHVAVTQDQFDRTWQNLAPVNRYFDETEPRSKAGYLCIPMGNLLVWVDQFIPKDQWSDEVEAEVKRVNDKLFFECGKELYESGKKKMLMSFHDRVIEEKKELGEKAVKLSEFISHGLFKTVPAAEQERLTRQLRIMDEYCQVLNERIAAFPTAG